MPPSPQRQLDARTFEHLLPCTTDIYLQFTCAHYQVVVHVLVQLPQTLRETGVGLRPFGRRLFVRGGFPLPARDLVPRGAGVLAVILL